MKALAFLVASVIVVLAGFTAADPGFASDMYQQVSQVLPHADPCVELIHARNVAWSTLYLQPHQVHKVVVVDGVTVFDGDAEEWPTRAQIQEARETLRQTQEQSVAAHCQITSSQDAP